MGEVRGGGAHTHAHVFCWQDPLSLKHVASRSPSTPPAPWRYSPPTHARTHSLTHSLTTHSRTHLRANSLTHSLAAILSHLHRYTRTVARTRTLTLTLSLSLTASLSLLHQVPYDFLFWFRLRVFVCWSHSSKLTCAVVCWSDSSPNTKI